MAFVIKPDGDFYEIYEEKRGRGLSLEQLQKAVGGMIEWHPARDGKHEIVINEEGKLLGLPINEEATDRYWTFDDPLRGNVVVARKGEIK